MSAGITSIGLCLECTAGSLLSVFSGSVRDLILYELYTIESWNFTVVFAVPIMMLFHNVLIGFYIVMNLENYLGIMM